MRDLVDFYSVIFLPRNYILNSSFHGQTSFPILGVVIPLKAGNNYCSGQCKDSQYGGMTIPRTHRRSVAPIHAHNPYIISLKPLIHSLKEEVDLHVLPGFWVV